MAGSQHKRSLWMGAFISPWVVPVGMALLLGVLYLVSDDKHYPPPGDVAGILLALIVFGVPFTYLVTFILVAPMAFLLRMLHALSMAKLCLWCAFLGPVTMYAFTHLLNGQNAKELSLAEITLGAGYGLISGAAFCLISGVRLFVGNKGTASPNMQ